MLGLVETLVGRTLGSLRGLLGGIDRIKLLKNVNCTVVYVAQVFIRNTTDLRFESIHYDESIHCDESIHYDESIQLPLPFLSSSFAYTHPIELGVGPLGS